MEDLRQAARDALQHRDLTTLTIPNTQLSAIAITGGLDQLWDNISSHTDTGHLEACESLLVVRDFLKLYGSTSSSDSDGDAASKIYTWASSMALPSPVFAVTSDEDSKEQKRLVLDDQLRSLLALSVISSLNELVKFSVVASAADTLLALASFTSQEDPWTTHESYEQATALLADCHEPTSKESNFSFWTSIEKLLKEKVRPIFAKTRNPAITAAGRKNFHPVPLARFDASILDSETKPWKTTDVYATVVLSWIVKQYQPGDKSHLEAHFPLMVPPILSLIDDDTTSFKARGCNILSQLMSPIKESKSDILQRTNLSSVFEDAIKPCLLSLPTITPEDESLQLLGAAYPALLSLLRLNFTNAPTRHSSTAQPPKERYMSSLATTLRESLISSIHHISSTSTASTSTIASFPYPKLSTLLFQHVSTVINELGIHTTKYLQDIAPLIHTTLSNPFGPAYPPLLFASLSVTRAVILNAHPRLWRWRGEILGAFCSCYLHAVEEEAEIVHTGREEDRGMDEPSGPVMKQLKKELKGVVYLLRLALENVSTADADEGQLEAKENIAKEIQELVQADDTLEDLLGEVDTKEVGLFGHTLSGPL